jgi:hypothetical protein
MTMNACMTTSWDDGHPLDFRIADLLDANGLCGTFYIPQSADTGTMPANDVRRLSERFEIGAHTIHHTFLDTVDEPTAKAEIAGSKAWVEDVTGEPCKMFCPPAGKFVERDSRLVREAGYVGLRSVELLSLDWPRSSDGLLIMPTTLHAFPHRPVTYIKNAVKRRSPRNLWHYVIHGGRASWEERAERMLAQVTARGGVFHLWGHSWELEETTQWDRLERVLKLMGRFKNQLPCLTNREVCHEFQGRQLKAAG